jgi:ATP-dependent DNA ligase
VTREAAIRRSGQPQKSGPPRWLPPQLSKLVEKAPSGDKWVHEIKFDGYSRSGQSLKGLVLVES